MFACVSLERDKGRKGEREKETKRERVTERERERVKERGERESGRERESQGPGQGTPLRGCCVKRGIQNDVSF